MWNRLKEIFEYRYMIVGLTHRDLRGRYKGSMFGFLWNFFNPLAQILVYIVVFTLIFRNNIECFYAYLIIGMIPWNFFADSLSQGSGCIFAQCEMVKKIYFPREVLPIAAVTSRFINYMINIVIVLVIVGFSPAGIDFKLLPFLPILMIINYIFVLGLTLILSAIDVYFRDFEYMTSVFLMALIWATPIMYSAEGLNGILGKLIWLNPMTHFISAYHELIYYHRAVAGTTFAKLFIMAAAALLIGEFIFRKLERNFAEEM